MKRWLIAGFVLAFLAGPVARGDDDIPRLIERLTKDEKGSQRRSAAHALGELGPKARIAVPDLVKALNDPDSSVRDAAQEALVKIGEPAVEELIAALEHEDKFVRMRAAEILGLIGPDARDAIPSLEEATNDSSMFVREAASEALFRVKVDVKSLIELLKDASAEKRLYAVRGLGVLGPLAKPALPALAKTLRHDKSATVRREAAKTIGTFGAEAKNVMAALVGALSDKDDRVRLHAVNALAEMGPVARPSIPYIARAVKRYSRDEEFRQAATRAAMLIQTRRRRR